MSKSWDEIRGCVALEFMLTNGYTKEVFINWLALMLEATAIVVWPLIAIHGSLLKGYNNTSFKGLS